MPRYIIRYDEFEGHHRTLGFEGPFEAASQEAALAIAQRVARDGETVRTSEEWGPWTEDNDDYLQDAIQNGRVSRLEINEILPAFVECTDPRMLAFTNTLSVPTTAEAQTTLADTIKSLQDIAEKHPSHSVSIRQVIDQLESIREDM